jgi:hypothetical protein
MPSCPLVSIAHVLIGSLAVGNPSRNFIYRTLLAKQTGEIKGFVWRGLYGKLAKFSLSQMPRSCTELFRASELPNAVSG